jgi:ApaG protein
MLMWGILQDYKEAARLRDMIKALECEDPVLRLKIMMEKAIAEEQYAVLH